MSTDPVGLVLGWLPILLVFVTGLVLVLYSSTAFLSPRRRTPPSEAKSASTLEPQRTDDDRAVTSTSATTGTA